MTRRYEHFKINRWARTYNRSTGKFTVSIAYETATKVTPRTIAVSEAFGLGVDQHQKFVIYDNVELKIGPKDIVLITGDSGSGKSVLLKALMSDIRENSSVLGGVMSVTDVVIDEEKPLIETIGKTVEEGLELLSRVGLNDAFLFIRRFKELSDGQKYRYRIAKLIESGAQWWVMDEFCATLDRDTAKIVAFNVQKLARFCQRGVLAATTHTDLFEDLAPSVHVHKRYGKEISVDYFPNVAAKQCSLTNGMYVVKGTLKDYEQLAGFHYRDSKGVAVAQKVFALKRGDETVGVIVYKSPGFVAVGRLLAVGRKIMLAELNKDFTVISRVVVHPKYRTMGLGAKLVQETLEKCGRPYVESIAVMARFNPFFERAGMRNVAQSKPDRRILRTLQRLGELGFDEVYLSSQAYNLHKLSKDPALLVKVKDVIRDFGRGSGIYRKRLAQVREAILARDQFEAILANADADKVAAMLRILGILAQPKVYLFWRSPALDFLKFLQDERAKVTG